VYKLVAFFSFSKSSEVKGSFMREKGQGKGKGGKYGEIHRMCVCFLPSAILRTSSHSNTISGD